MEKKKQKTQVLIRERKNNLAKWGKMQGMINYHTPFTPMRGDPVNTTLPTEQNTLLKQLCLIPGHGIRLRQTPSGIIIETYDTNKTFSTGASKLADAVVGTIENIEHDGSYRVTFLGEDDKKTSDYTYEINSAVSTIDRYNEGDKILCFPIKMPEAPVGEL